jgi:cytochrome c-type biogenesis protein CcmF
MIPFLGRLLIYLSLLAAAAGSVVAFMAGRRPTAEALRWTRWSAYTYAAVMVAANALMVFALLIHDFSVSYVAQVGSRAVPVWVSVVSLWSSLEGSILFWGLVLAIYIVVATRASHERYSDYLPGAVGVWLACAAFFSFLLAAPAQPFLTVANPPADGPGPNPLLQNHVLMAIHPPFLYLGYVGMTIPFGFASAALLKGRLGSSFVGPLRTSLLIPWTFLTVAIVLGGWWAYEVLGWGGYWAWDPVENASLLPWLTATAALHSAIVMQRKGTLKGWTVTLVMTSFLLTILGTFMTRSGVFNSVHSFTQSAIGPTILVFLAIALVWSIGLLALRIDKLSSEGVLEGMRSRDGMFLINNLLFVLMTFTVLLGTVFPLIVEAVRGVQMSVGRPYFDKMAVPIGAALLFLMGIGPALPWGRATNQQLRRSLLPPLAGGLVLATIGYAAGVRGGWTLVALAFGGYAAFVTLREMWRPVAARRDRLARSFLDRQRRRLGAYVVHAGAVVVIIAIAVSSTMERGREVQLRRGQSTTIGDYTLTFLGAEEVSEPHRLSTRARMSVARGGSVVAFMNPAMNQYRAQREPIGTPDVRSTLTHDLYLSVMNVNAADQTVGLLVKIVPMVSWIWIATAVMGLGGLMAAIPTRRRLEASAALRVAEEAG